MIDKLVDLAENLTPTALIGAGGIGKTSITLKVLHHDRIKQRFGDDRRFIRCDQFPRSCTHLLSRLSKVTGAGVENPEDLASLRPFLSSREIFIVLDNAESILDPAGTDAKEIYGVVEELSQLDNVSLCVTSRISTVPPDCETLDVPTLSIDAARDAFYRIYKNVGRTDLVDTMLGQLDFHPLSITLLATVAHQNKWGTDRLTKEWKRQRTKMLQTMHNRSFATTIELSLASPMFQELGSDARALLEVIAFFPQGIDENNLDWLFPTISNGADIFDKLCVLSLTYRNDSFITMLAPLRDHLRPKDPLLSPLLCKTKGRYFTRMSVMIDPNHSGFQESQWIASEDVNVEYLLDVFTTIDAKSNGVWEACTNFMCHLCFHKERLTILGPKIEGLPDDHPSKPNCLFQLSKLFQCTGNYMKYKRLLTHTLKLNRERGDDRGAAQTLWRLSLANQSLDLCEEGIKQVEEASQICKRLSDVVAEATCLASLAVLLYSTDRLDAAKEAASRALNIFSEKGNQFNACNSHFILGLIYHSKGETEEAIHHHEASLRMASSSWHGPLFSAHHALMVLFLDEARLDDAQAHIEYVKLHAHTCTYAMGYLMESQASSWHVQGRFEEAKAEALRAADVYEKLRAEEGLESCRQLLLRIEEGMNKPAIPGKPDDGELLARKLALFNFTDVSHSGKVTESA